MRSSGVFGFLRKKKPPGLTPDEVKELLDLLFSASLKMIRGIDAPEGWEIRSKQNVHAEFACFVIFAAIQWHKSRADQIGDYSTLLDLYRGNIEQKISLFSTFELFNKIPLEKFVANRCRFYETSSPDDWSQVFARLSIFERNKYKLELHDPPVEELLLSQRIFQNSLEVYHLHVHFTEAVKHQLPVQLDIFKTLHSARLRKVIE